MSKDIIKDDKKIQKLSNFLKVIGDKTRSKIILLLIDKEMKVSDISKELNMTNSSISHQLKKMKDFNVVKNRKDGKEVYYSLDDDHVKNIILTTLDHISHEKEI